MILIFKVFCGVGGLCAEVSIRSYISSQFVEDGSVYWGNGTLKKILTHDAGLAPSTIVVPIVVHIFRSIPHGTERRF